MFQILFILFQILFITVHLQHISIDSDYATHCTKQLSAPMLNQC